MADAFTREAFILLGVGIGVVTLRSIARVSLVGLKGLWVEYVQSSNTVEIHSLTFTNSDYLMLFATVSLVLSNDPHFYPSVLPWKKKLILSTGGLCS